MRVVIDTNVVVSAALKGGNPEAVLTFVTSRPDFEWIVTRDILEEYFEVLGREKFGLPARLHRRWVDFLENVTTSVEVEETLPFDRDPKDARFVACALAVAADWLITGDRDLEDARRLLGTTVISVTRFKKLVCDALAG